MSKFTDCEVRHLEEHPDAIRLVAHYNDVQESHADSMGASSSAEHHRARRIELTREARKIEDENDGSTNDAATEQGN